MADLNIDELVRQMSDAARKALGNQLPETFRYAEDEFKKLGEVLRRIQAGKQAGAIDAADAALLVEMQKNAIQTVLLTVVGSGTVLAEQVLNAALGVVRDVVNSALGWPLL
ncbi:hypothetical protein EDC14_100835 [Hydrogenispora ethanolica]|jgi:hypothetical protein|uniref:Uncharacterized protein n=1 Tax=Hydrogenispora ethanolica TaxID=1082276 RepID=A0A4R1RXI1_HYDET|nr:hypothetical protein [Hydrogenispora ethanolica]TCL70890.1 hypothetical protein EDC14_100835 [Hydrogenispora ethanolica]